MYVANCCVYFFLQLKCCGVMVFSDYQDIFNNLSVPLSCCNIDNPLVNETTCPVIVSNALQANRTGLIYSEVSFNTFLYPSCTSFKGPTRVCIYTCDVLASS